jgi:hypothetical protein
MLECTLSGAAAIAVLSEEALSVLLEEPLEGDTAELELSITLSELEVGPHGA